MIRLRLNVLVVFRHVLQTFMDTGYGYITCWQKEVDKVDTVHGQLECVFLSDF